MEKKQIAREISIITHFSAFTETSKTKRRNAFRDI